MKWEYIGQQELPTRKGKMSINLRPEMWRTRVPGGWLLLMSNIHDLKSPFFYPDPDHIWEVDEEKTSQEASTLLRPAGKPPLITEE